MNPHRAFVRKIGYLVAIGVLLVPLFWLGHPATSAPKKAKGAARRLAGPTPRRLQASARPSSARST